MRFYRLILIILTVSLITGCGNMHDIEKTKQELIDTDKAFNEMSLAEGYKKAFDYYMAEDAIIYRSGSFPFKGKATINELLAKDPDAVLKWEPFLADVGQSGDLGYTLGSYEYIATDSAGVETSYYGSYVSIWKKQTDGSWKYVFDTGQPSPAPDN